MPAKEREKDEMRKHPAQPQVAGEKEFLSEDEEDDAVDKASEDSFPASDPPSHTPVSHPGKPKKSRS